jgi:hypothetical protein
MSDHRNPRPSLADRPSADNFDPGISPRRTKAPAHRLTKGALLGVEDALDELRRVIARTAAAAYAVEDLHEKILWDDRTDERDEDQRREHLALLIETTKTAAMEAVQMGEELSSEMFRLRTARRGAKP